MSKQLFNSTEKSNFILNMTEEKFSEIAGWGLSSVCFTTAVFALLPEISESVSYAIVSGGLAVSGVICLILALIAVMKKYINRKQLFPVCAFAVMFVWGMISLADSYSLNIGFYGFTGRGEGMLAILFYFGFFVTAVSVKREKAVKSLINAVIASGVIHSLFSLVQIFTGDFSQYKHISISEQINASSGLAQSPVFLAMFLSLTLIASLIRTVLAKNHKQLIIYISCSCLFAFVMMFTYSVVGIAGIILAVLSALLSWFVFIREFPKKNLISLPVVIMSAVSAVIIINCGLIENIPDYKLHDSQITLWADGYMRLSANGDKYPEKFDISDNADTRSYIYRETIKIIKKFPLTGTGAEQLVYPQLYTYDGLDKSVEFTEIIPRNKGTFDKIYNEYLYVTATRGIPSLIALLAVIVSVIVIGLKKISKKPSATELCNFLMFLCGVIIFFISCGNITFSPVFWSLCGFVICRTEKSE
ncbi:MAG: O-antigen ligase family protein [Ruminococcus sp.]|nr:O-antigen ligase family protein [Ruminococcus sp.]